MRKCYGCKETKTQEYFSKNQDTCKVCQNAYAKKRRKLKKEHDATVRQKYRSTEEYKELHRKASKLYRQKNMAKSKCRDKLNSAIRWGRMTRGVCSVCGLSKDETRIEAHHEDYTKPLDVIWFCTKHHREYELAEKTTNRAGTSYHAGVKKA